MPRKKRIIYPNAWYHVMNRGAGRRYVLEDKNHNKQTFLELLEATSIKYNFEVHAYCIMDNHYHLLVRTPDANLVESMRYLMSMYGRIYNIKNESDGPLFRDRFKALLILSDSSLLQVFKYIHRNPLEANFAFGLHYKWSSFNYYEKSESKPSWLQTDHILSNFNSVSNKQRLYDWHLESDDQNLKRFYQEHETDNFAIMKEFEDFSIISKNTCMFSLDRISSDICEFFNIQVSELKGASRGKTNHYRNIFVFISINIYDYTTNDISTFLEYSDSSFISRLNIRVKSKLDEKRIILYRKVRYNLSYIINQISIEYSNSFSFIKT